MTSGGQSANQVATLTITDLTLIDYWDMPHGFVGEPYVGHTFTVANAAGPVTWSIPAWSPLPPGLSLTPAGSLTGTPTSSGYYNITIGISDGAHTVYKGYSLPVYDVHITTPGILPLATQGSPYDAIVEAVGGSGSYTFTANSMPPGLVLDGATGHISGMPTNAGRWTINVSAVDGNGISYTKVFALWVLNPPASLPALTTGAALDDCTYGVPCARWIGANTGTPPFTWSATGLPAGMEIRATGATPLWLTPGDAVLIGSPLELGTYPVEVTATDATGASVTNTFSLRVSPLNLNPYPTGGTIDVPYSEKLRIIGGTGPYTGALTSGTLPAGVTLDGATLALSGTPAENGSFYPEFSVTDNAGTPYRIHPSLYFSGGASTVQINSWYDLGTARPGFAYSNTLSACCLPTYQWSISGGTLPPGLTMSSSGTLAGTPTTNGIYTFLVRVQDPTNPPNHAMRQFTLTISPISVTTASTLPFGNVGTPYSLALTASIPPGSLTWSLVPGNPLPPGLILTTAGLLQGTPTHTGLYNFSARAVDGIGNTAVAYLWLSIYPAGSGPPLNLSVSSVFTSVKGTFYNTLQATGGTQPYTYSWTPGATPIAGLRVQTGPPLPTFLSPTSSGVLMGVLETAGSYSSSLRVTDAMGQTIDRAFTVNVSPLELPFSPGDLPRAHVGVPYVYTLSVTGGSGNYAWSSTSLPFGFSLTPSGGLSGTPSTAGTITASVMVTDMNTSLSRSLTLTIQVNAFEIVSAGTLPQATVNGPYGFSFAAPGCDAPCTWSLLGGVPAGFSLAPSTGLLSGTPTQTGTFAFNVRATSASGSVSNKTVSLVIAPSTPTALAITTGPFSDTVVGSMAFASLTAQGGTPPYQWSVVGGVLPSGVALQTLASTIIGSAAPGITAALGRVGQTGTSAFTLQVSDAAGATVTRAFTWNITGLNLEYTSLPLSGGTIVYGTPYAQALLAIGGTSNYTWTAETAMPPGLTLDASTGTVSGTPANTGFFSTTVRVNDNEGRQLRRNVSFNILSGTPAILSFNEGPNLGVIARGQSFSRTLSLSGVVLPPASITATTPLPPGFALLNGISADTLVLPGGTSLVGTPLEAGTFSFTLRAQDSTGNIGVRTFTLTVASVTVPFSNLFDGSVGVAYSQPLLAFNENPPTTWSVSATSILPPGLSLSTAGLLSGTPTQAGTFSFTLNVSDALGIARSQSYSLRVSTLGIASDSILPTAVAGVPYTYTLTATGGGASKVWSASSLPSGLTLSSSTGTISGTPTASAGVFGVVVTVTDGGVPFQKRFTLFARLPNPNLLSFGLPALTIPDVWLGQVVSFGLNTGTGQPPLTWTVSPGSALPPGLSLLSGAAAAPQFGPGGTGLVGSPTVAGHYAFDLVATDSVGQSIVRTFTLNVSPIAVVSTALKPASTGVAFAQQLVGVGGTPPYAFSIAPVSATQDMLPPGFTLSATGLLSGTTTSTGFYTFQLRLQDAVGNTFARTASLGVSTSAGLRIAMTNIADTWVGGGILQPLANPGASTYSWSVVNGALPPGIALAPSTTTPGGTVLTGQPQSAGTFTYTLRAFDNASPATSVDHAFTLNILPMQVVSPPVALIDSPDLPNGQTGAPYSTTIRMAGGTPPYTFAASPFSPLPPGLSLSSAGVLSGTPQWNGVFVVQPIVSDASGATGLSRP